MIALALVELDIGKSGVIPDIELPQLSGLFPTSVVNLVLQPSRQKERRQELEREERRRRYANEAIIAESTDARDNPIIASEESALVDAGLLVAREANPNSTYVLLGTPLHPRAEGMLTLTPIGALLTHMMELRLIPDPDCNAYLAETRGPFR
jgi:hypothetical protein